MGKKGQKAGALPPAASPAAATLPPFLKPQSASSCLLTVRATPGARSSSLVLGQEAVEVRIDAPPVEGKANEAITEFVAEVLGLKRRAVSLSAGGRSRDKVLAVEGLAAEAALQLLLRHAEAGG